MTTAIVTTGNVSRWAKEFNLIVKRVEERPDQPTGDTVFKVKHIFTTRDGSWDASDKPGSIESWARDEFLSRAFDDAGADHHLFARVLDSAGKPITDDIVAMWSGFENLGQPGTEMIRFDTKPHSGWGNQPVFNKFDYAAGHTGAWCWAPKGAAEVVCGGGLPGGMHVSFFVVWQAEKRTGGGEGGGGITPVEVDLEKLRQRVWQELGIASPRNARLANYARIHSLGGPLTSEFEADGFRVQGFIGGIAYAALAQPDDIAHMPW